MHFLSSVNMHRVSDATQMQAMLEAGQAWGAPYVFIYRDVAGSGLLPSYAESLGKVTLGTELGSASQFGVTTLNIAARGLRNVLALRGFLPNHQVEPSAQQPQIVASELRGDYIMAPADGIFEPFVELGDVVRAGKAIGQMHFVTQPAWKPQQVLALTDGMVISRRAFPLTKQGECVAVITRPFSH